MVHVVVCKIAFTSAQTRGEISCLPLVGQKTRGFEPEQNEAYKRPPIPKDTWSRPNVEAQTRRDSASATVLLRG